MSFPRQRPRQLTPEAVEAWNRSKLEWYASSGRPVHTWPWSILKEFQTKNNILTTGSRELQNWRVERFLRGEPTTLSPVKRSTYYSDALPVFTVFPHRPSYFFRDSDHSGILCIHRDVLETKILVHLHSDPQAIFALMLTCKDLQGVCQRLLCMLAQQRFGPLGTPKALLCAVLYETKWPEEMAKKASRKRAKVVPPPPAAGEEQREEDSPPPPAAGGKSSYFKKDLKAVLGLQGRDFKASNVHVTDVQTIIEIAIKKYGCLDNLPRVRQKQAQQVHAREQERAFVAKNVATRVAQVNAYFASLKYHGLAVEMRDGVCTFTDARVPLILSTFENNNDYRVNHLLGSIRDWVNMQVERSMDSVCVPIVGMVPNVLFNTAMSNASSAEPYHPLQALVVQMLIDVRNHNYMFYDQIMTEGEWLERLGYVFSDHFRHRHRPETMHPGNGSYVCCWRRGRPDMKIYDLNTQTQSTPLQYFAWMKLLDSHFHLRLATPATGIPYTGLMPTYYVAGGRQVNFAHCLLSKK